MNQIVTVAGTALNTRVDGPEGAPWLVLSNSLGATLEMWEPQMPALTAKCRVLRYDTRGHGGSGVAAGETDFAALVADVIGLMDHYDIKSAAYMGLSLGGMTGLGLALNHPDRVERLIVADARADAPPAYASMWDDRIAAVSDGGLEAILGGTLMMWLTEDWRLANPDATDAVRNMVLSNDAEGYIACCRALRRLDYLKDLGKLTVPTLYVGGDVDKGAAPEVMQQMADATPGGTFIPVANAAHIANINAPEAFTTAISDFLGL